MADHYLHGTTGGATPLADLSDALKAFLTTTCGWTCIHDFTATTGTTWQHRVYTTTAKAAAGCDYGVVVTASDVVAPGIIMRVVGWWGASVHPWDITHTYGYDDAVAGHRTGTPGLYQAVSNNVTVKAGLATDYWFFADDYRFIIITQIAGPAYPVGYAGFVDSGYPAATDPYPLLIKGSSGVASWQTEGSGCRMFDATPMAENYSAMNPTWNNNLAFMEGGAGVTVQPSKRTAPNTYEAIEPILATTGAAGAKPELRGVPRGVVRICNAIASGTTLVLPNGKTYVVFDSHAYGPVV